MIAQIMNFRLRSINHCNVSQTNSPTNPENLAPPDQPRSGSVWHTLVPKTRLMTDPHCENGGQDFRIFGPNQVCPCLVMVEFFVKLLVVVRTPSKNALNLF